MQNAGRVMNGISFVQRHIRRNGDRIVVSDWRFMRFTSTNYHTKSVRDKTLLQAATNSLATLLSSLVSDRETYALQHSTEARTPADLFQAIGRALAKVTA